MKNRILIILMIGVGMIFLSCSKGLVSKNKGTISFEPAALRIEPSKKAKAIIALNLYSVVNIVDRDVKSVDGDKSKFLKVKFGESEGYVLASVLSDGALPAVITERASYRKKRDGVPEAFLEKGTMIFIYLDSIQENSDNLIKVRCRIKGKLLTIFIKKTMYSMADEDVLIISDVIPNIEKYLQKASSATNFDERQKQLDLASIYIKEAEDNYPTTIFIEKLKEYNTIIQNSVGEANSVEPQKILNEEEGNDYEVSE